MIERYIAKVGTLEGGIGSIAKATFRWEPMLSEEAKERLRQNLDKVHEWPSVYMFKFIFEPDAERLASVMALFPVESEMLRKYSSGGKYLSLTVKEVMMNADDVVSRYDRAAAITGVIIL